MDEAKLNHEDPPQLNSEQAEPVLETQEQPVEIPETKKAEVERTKEVQSAILRNWAERQNPPLVEGVDFMIPKIEDEENPENISPHEMTNVYFGFKVDKENPGKMFKVVKEFFEKEYSSEMQKHGIKKETWTPDTKLNYSWAGRFCIEGAGGGAIDTAPLQSVNPIICETHHQEFKDFFKQEAGFDLPSPEKLDEILEKMSDNLEWYKTVLAELKGRIKSEEQKKISGGESESWKYNRYVLNLEYIVKILTDAKYEKDKKATGLSDVGPDRKMAELPEVITGKIDEKIRHYNDLTYNADDHFDLDEVCGVLGDSFHPPVGAGTRIDRIYEDNFGFDRKEIEDICRKFSEKLYRK